MSRASLSGFLLYSYAKFALFAQGETSKFNCIRTRSPIEARLFLRKGETRLETCECAQQD
ncbi:hypothetical protein CWC21_16480 [Pseudoalteromonas phenolica]|nr:hypothetical protein CWC21_16480 [Pseudoalteromonas phenolica]